MWKLPINVEGGRKHLLPRSGCGQKLKLGRYYSGQLQAEARCIVQHPGFEETGEGLLRLHLFCYKTSLHSTSLVFVFFVLDPVVFCP